jgi:integrase
MARTPRVPKYCLHSPSDRGYARFGSPTPTYFPGPFNSPQSVAAYNAALALYLSTGRPEPPAAGSATVGELVVAFERHVQAAGLYRKGGRQTDTPRNLKAAFAAALELYRATPAADLDLQRMDALKAHMRAKGWADSTVRTHFARVRSLLLWGEGRGLVPAGLVARVTAAERGLGTGRRARGSAKPRPKPADLADVGAVALAAGPPVCSMIWLQLLNGMRPGAVCALRPRDVDRTGRLWRYTEQPDLAAKTESETHWLGPRAQSILGPYLDACPTPDAFAFRPARSPHGRFHRTYYHRIIARLCKRLGVPHWWPHQLRHSHATLVRRLYGAEAAQLRLGHTSMRTAELYAALPTELIQRIASEIG